MPVYVATRDVVTVHRTFTGKVHTISRRSIAENDVSYAQKLQLNTFELNRDTTERRYYFNDSSIFDNLLRNYNTEGALKDGPLHCVGYVNVSMRMCSLCGDFGKRKRAKDRYYIFINERAHLRTILCHGCLGYKIRLQYVLEKR